MAEITYKLEPRGRSGTAVVRVDPNGNERIINTYKNAGSAGNVRLALAIAAGSEVAGR